MEFIRHDRFVFHLLMGIVLVLIYPMQALFSGNQNIYFLWGMADMLPHVFAADPLLASPDPYPLFSWLIGIFPVQFLSVWTTLLYVLLSSIYSFSLFGIADGISPLYKNGKRLLSFTALFLFLHSAPVWGTYFQLVLDMDLRWMWDSGIAEQGVLRGYLQPSVFGVFLLLSIYFASRKNLTAAILCIAPAAAMHANYLFLGAILTVILLLQYNFEKKAFIASSVLLIMLLPYAYYVFHHFVHLDDTTKSALNAAVLAGLDENIHLNPHHWLNAKFYLQLTIMGAGMAAIWNSHLRGPMLALSGFGLVLTLLAYGIGSTVLISLNPWRVSVLIMPIAVVALLTKAVHTDGWNVLRPHILSAILVVAIALVAYRIFGSPSQSFLKPWKMVQIASFFLVLMTAGFIFKFRIMSRSIAPLVIMALILVGVVDRYVDGITKSSKEEFQVISVISQKEEPNTIYIIPPEWTSFRMNAQKAVFVDKNLVYGPALPSLMHRLELIAAANGSNNYQTILDVIPSDLHVKLITSNSSNFKENVEPIADSFICVTLR